MDILRIRNEKGEWVGVPAIKGENAYELAVECGYEGTKEEWLASLKGDKGNKGEKGDPGEKGAATKIIAYPLGYGRDVDVGYSTILPAELAGTVQYGDFVVDTLGGCMFQFVFTTDPSGEYVGEAFNCVANLNGKDGKDGKDGNDGNDGKDGSKIIAYPLGFGTDVAVGYEDVLPDELYGRVKHLDLVVDTLGGCMFQYKEYEGDDEGSMPAESFKCVSNPNGKDAVVDKQLSHDSENAIANKAVNEKISEIFSVMSAIEGTSARTDLSNVSNEDFAAKANAAGVGGGASGAVVFKGVVSELPYNAKNGEMYKLGADIIDTKNYHKIRQINTKKAV